MSTCTSCIGLWLCELMVECSCHCLAACQIPFILGSALQPDESPTFLETWWAMQEVLRTGSIRQNSCDHHETNRLLFYYQGKRRLLVYPICRRNILPLFRIIQDQLLSQLSIKSRPIHVCHNIGCSNFVAIEGFF